MKSKFPKEFDNDTNLFKVSDSLSVSLGMDYHPGDTTILAEGNLDRFPPSGIITLVDQQTATSFYYGKKTNTAFTDLILLEDSIDSYKPKKNTLITQQVMAEHHNSKKNAIVAIEEFLGTKYAMNNKPFQGTIFGRINFLKKVLFSPKAWFHMNKTKGLAPLQVTFTSQSSGTVGPVGTVFYEWDFGDGDIVTTAQSSYDKIYDNPGIYTVSLKIGNTFGEDKITFEKAIKVIQDAPDEAILDFNTSDSQVKLNGRIRTLSGESIYLKVQDGRNKVKNFSGEWLHPNTSRPMDKIVKYIWRIPDDLIHENVPEATALFSIGGLYDVNLRVETELGAYRINNYKNMIDVIESKNLWFWTINDNQIQCNEFNLIAETFKTPLTKKFKINRNNSFLQTGRIKQEFNRNNGCSNDNTSSGHRGNCKLFWATGRTEEQSPLEEKIELVDYTPFTDTYKSNVSINRPWNWTYFSGNEETYFILGNPNIKNPASRSHTNQTKTVVGANIANDKIEFYNYKNGAHELMGNAVKFDDKGEPYGGHYSIYRTTWKDNTGYLARNEKMNSITFKSFYMTEGILGENFLNITKTTDMPLTEAEDIQLVPLETGIHSFGGNDLCIFDDLTNVWKTTPSTLPPSNNLFATSDKTSKAYLSSDKYFIKYDSVTNTYTNMNHQPADKQWLLTIY